MKISDIKDNLITKFNKKFRKGKVPKYSVIRQTDTLHEEGDSMCIVHTLELRLYRGRITRKVTWGEGTLFTGYFEPYTVALKDLISEPCYSLVINGSKTKVTFHMHGIRSRTTL